MYDILQAGIGQSHDFDLRDIIRIKYDTKYIAIGVDNPQLSIQIVTPPKFTAKIGVYI